ncbi:MAG: carbohydrate ABC transporter permease [Anaerolineae bacterium]
MATQAMTEQKAAIRRPRAGIFTGRRGRALREYLTAYLFLAPAAVLLFTFGIFPIFYAGYVSLYKWRIKQGEYRGLANFVNAMGDVAYVFFGIIILALAYSGIMTLIRALRTARENEIPYYFPLVALIPGAATAYGMGLIILRFITFFTQEGAIEKGYAQVLGNVPLGLFFIVVGVVANVFLDRWQHNTVVGDQRKTLPSFATAAVMIVATLAGAYALGRFTSTQLLSSGTAFVAWVKIRATVTGLASLAIAYVIWSWGMRQFSTRKLAAAVIAAAAFIGGGVYLINIWPIVSAGSDPDFYLSLSATVFYAIGAVPIQLSIALVLAYLLFQNLKGKGFFRVVFFIPYVAPTVAGAAIFDVLFSLRDTSIANRFVQFITRNPDLALRWLKEPNTLIATIGQAFGFEPVGTWDFGPSLALTVIIFFSIWRFVGYDTVIFLAGLGGIPNVLYEAAKIDGASRWQLFRHVTLPLLSPTTFFLSVISVIGTFKAFNSIWVLRDASALGTSDTASVYFFETFFRGSRFGYATSMAMILFIIILTLTTIQNRLAERKVFYG